MPLILLRKLRERGRRLPGAPAIWHRDAAGRRTATAWGPLAGWAGAIAQRLARDFQPGRVVMLRCSNQPLYTAAFMGALAAGLRIMPVSMELTSHEIRQAAERAGAAGLLADPLLIRELALENVHPIALDELAALPPLENFDAELENPRSDLSEVLLLSSGTTAQPKIVRRSGQSLDAVASNTASSIGMVEGQGVLCAIPLCHSYGMEHGLVGPMMGGAAAHLLDRFQTADAIEEIENGATILPAVPFMIEALCRLPEGAADFSRIRQANSASAPLPLNIRQMMLQTHGLRVGQLYGATEIGSVTFHPIEVADFDASTVGWPMKDVSVRILEPGREESGELAPPHQEGHVAIAAPSMLCGYADEPGPELVGGHFLTGDLGSIDIAGRLKITGRIKLLIDIGGLKVNPLEVEAAIGEHPQVGGCVVMGMMLGQTVGRLKAIVEPRTPGQTPDAEQIKQFLKPRLAGYKIPRLIEIRDHLPRTPAGKIIRHGLE